MELTIGNIHLPHPTVLGPMAGVTDLPFRLLCKEMGAGLVVTEMISAKALTYHNPRTEELLETRPEEAPLSVQIFGHEPEVMGEAAELLEAKSFGILDINMGCPVPKVVNNGEGSALMKDPALIEKIVAACVQHSSRPVTCKMRLGFDTQHINVVDCARAAEAGGASAIAVHGRTRSQYYQGEADWAPIAEVVKAVSIPVIGNGDVKDGPSARRLLEETGCAGVMIARAADGNPWIFREINSYLEEGVELPRPTHREVIRMILKHADLVKEIKGESRGILEMRRHVCAYLQGFPGASKLRQRINLVTSFDDLRDLLEKEFPYA